MTDKKETKEQIQTMNFWDEHRNIVLIGMPNAGKTQIGKIVAERLGLAYVDTDQRIVEKAGMSIPAIFRRNGEPEFREMETAVIRSLEELRDTVIATGGGVILRRENVESLRKNGTFYFLDKPLAELKPSKDKPTAPDRPSMERLYSVRYKIYRETADHIIDVGQDPAEVAEKVIDQYQLDRQKLQRGQK